MIDPKCPFCGSECTIQTAYSDDLEYVRHFECNKCHGVFREVHRLKFDRLETLRKPTRRAANVD